MLEKITQLALLGIPLVLIQPSSSYARNPAQHQKLPIYAQASQSLSARLTEADKVANKDPIAAVHLYRKVLAEIAHDEELRVQVIDKLLDTYGLATDRIIMEIQYRNTGLIGQALKFYSSLIDTPHNNRDIVAKAYLKWGILLARMEAPTYFEDAIGKLTEAYSRGNSKIMAEAAWQLGNIYYYYTLSTGGRSPIEPTTNLRKAKKYFKEVIQLDPEGRYTQAARNLLKSDDFKKIK